MLQCRQSQQNWSPQQVWSSYIPRLSILFAAPWLVDTIMNARTSKPLKLIPMVNAAAIKFNAEKENDKEYTTTAADHSGDFILWAWGVKAGGVSATRLTMDPKDADLEHFKIKRHQSCITQPWNNIPGCLPPPPHWRPSKCSSVRTSQCYNSTLSWRTRNAEQYTHQAAQPHDWKRWPSLCLSSGQQISPNQPHRIIQALHQQHEQLPLPSKS